MLGGITTFTNGHHTVNDQDGEPEGGDHLEHHILFNFNFSNFGHLDRWAGTYVKARRKGGMKSEGKGNAKGKERGRKRSNLVSKAVVEKL